MELVRQLVRFDTTSVDLSPGSDHTENEEEPLQALLAARLGALGAEVDRWEPDPASFAGHPMMPSWHHWRGRPITVGVLRGRGGGRALVINGHVDVVGAGERARWASDPFAAEIRDGRIYGRGACDMKGGIAAALVALEALGDAGIRLDGDVVFEAVTDEETCAMGTIAAIERGYRGDAGLVPEPTGFDLWIATRGLLHGTLSVEGRSAHAEMNQPSWQDGGGVNAIQKTMPLLGALDELSARWAGRADKRHPLLGTPAVHPTMISGGVFISNVPERCDVALNTTYLPGDADANGYGSVPRGEIEAAVADAVGRDDWLAAHPPGWSWYTDYPPSEIDPRAPIISVVQDAARTLDVAPRALGIDTTYDGALLTRFAGTPSPAFGPGDLGAGPRARTSGWGSTSSCSAAKLYARAVVAWCA